MPGLSASIQRAWEVDKGLRSALDFDGSGNLIYYGRALAGSLTSEAKWKIQKLAYDGSGNLLSQLWADGKEEFSQVWNDRASLGYS